MRLLPGARLSLGLTLLVLMHTRCVADFPTISVIPDQIISENGHTPPVPFTVVSTNYTLKASSSDALLFPSTNIVFGGSGSRRTVTITAAANRFGQATITVEADGTSGGALTTFLVTVNAQVRIQQMGGQALLSWTATNAVVQTANQLGLGWRDISAKSPYVVPRGATQYFQLRQQ